MFAGMKPQVRMPERTWVIEEAPPAVAPKLVEAFCAGARTLASVPLLPTVSQEVSSLLASPDVAMGRVARVVKRDPALAVQILKVANSAAYRGTSPVMTLDAALTRLGVRDVNRLLYSAAVGKLLVVRDRQELTKRLQWRAPVTAAAAARIAAHAGAHAEDAFIAGLLQDIGWAVSFALLPSLGARVTEAAGTDPAAVNRLVEHVHQDVGAAAAKAWNLSVAVVDAAGAHHHPENKPAAGLMAYVACAADRVCDSLAPGKEDRRETWASAWNDTVARRLKIDASVAERLREETRADAGG